MPPDRAEEITKLIADLEEAQRDIVTGESLEDNASVVITARDIRVLATALRSFSEAGWRFDMENAPRDGTKVDLIYAGPRGRKIDCFWHGGHLGDGWFWRTPRWSDGLLLPENEWDLNSLLNADPYAWKLAEALPPPPQESR